MVNYASVPKPTDTEEWTSGGEDAHTSIKTEKENGNVAIQQNAWATGTYFKDVALTIRKT